ncbi:MAG: radical SAM protein [Clostridia bacterium]|nr:radical SAM protein [Clostridia bacterium]
MTSCKLCPRACGIDREKSLGVCKESDRIRIAKVMLHHFEEPCISGGEKGAGSGAIFFSGCSLRCVYCQNKAVSRGEIGTEVTPEELASEMFRLRDAGAYNINLVTPTHFASATADVLRKVKPALGIPVVWNTSGYETVQTVESLRGLVDVFLTDFKYFSPELSKKYSSAPDYASAALPALEAMVKLTGKPRFEDGLLKRGTVVRHLVLPGAYRDSIKVLETVAQNVGAENVILSLMAQYTPEFLDPGYPELDRKITTFEYEKVLHRAEELGFDGYSQSRDSATSRFTPDF